MSPGALDATVMSSMLARSSNSSSSREQQQQSSSCACESPPHTMQQQQQHRQPMDSCGGAVAPGHLRIVTSGDDAAADGGAECTSSPPPTPLAPALAELIAMSLQQGTPRRLSVSGSGPVALAACPGSIEDSRKRCGDADQHPTKRRVSAPGGLLVGQLDCSELSGQNDQQVRGRGLGVGVGGGGAYIFYLSRRRCASPRHAPPPHSLTPPALPQQLHASNNAPTPRRPGMLRPLRLSFSTLEAPAAPLTDPHRAAVFSTTPAAAAAFLRLPPRSSTTTSPAEWIDRVEAQLSTRGRARSRSGAGDCFGGGGGGADAAAAVEELVPPAFVLLGRMGGGSPR